jgi:very-short-patch-repair endonuclease
MRKEMSPAERKLWSKLRGDNFHGLRFRRPHSIGIYIADFFCPRFNLVIEVDGDSHFEPEALKWDKDRSEYFAGLGLKELRFTNVEVFSNMDGVLTEIERRLGLT